MVALLLAWLLLGGRLEHCSAAHRGLRARFIQYGSRRPDSNVVARESLGSSGAALPARNHGMVASYRDGELNNRCEQIARTSWVICWPPTMSLRSSAGTARQPVQRELLLDTITHHSPMGLVLVDAHEHVAYANIARPPAGSRTQPCRARLPGAVDRAPEQLRTAARSSDDCCARARSAARRDYTLPGKPSATGRPHRLYLFKRLTRELSRQELSIWKKLIRVLSHELNNSLAPIASWHNPAWSSRNGGRSRSSCRIQRHQRTHRTPARFSSVTQSWPSFPTAAQAVDWRSLIDELAAHQPCRLEGCLPLTPGWFDRHK